MVEFSVSIYETFTKSLKCQCFVTAKVMTQIGINFGVKMDWNILKMSCHPNCFSWEGPKLC